MVDIFVLQKKHNNMTLQAAIEKILKQYKRPMTAWSIAQKINEEQLFVRADKYPIPSVQITQHVKKNPDKFSIYPDKYSEEYNTIYLYSDSRFNKRNRKNTSFNIIIKNITQKVCNKYKLPELESIVFVSALSIIIYIILSDKNRNSSHRVVKQHEILNKAKLLISEKHILSEVFSILVKHDSILIDKNFEDIYVDACSQIDGQTDNEFKAVLKEYLNSAGFIGNKKFLTFLFTSSILNRLLVELADPKEGELIFDPSSGIGNTLCEVSNRTKNSKLFGQEIDYHAYLLSQINFFICDIYNYKLFNGDSLRQPKIEKSTVDLIISHVPFGGRHKVTDLAFPISKDKKVYRSEELFIELMLSRLNEKGRIITLVTKEFLYSPLSFDLRKKLIDEDWIEAIIAIPKETFLPDLDTAIDILVINRNKESKRKGQVKFIEGNMGTGIFYKSDIPKPISYEPNKLVKKTAEAYHKENTSNGFYVPVETVIRKKYNLFSDTYTIPDLGYLIEAEDNQYFPLSAILQRFTTNKKIGDKSKIKIAQVKDLNDIPLDFYLNQERLSFIKDIPTNYRVIDDSALLVARVGKKIKPTYFKYKGESIGINPNVLAFKVSEEIIDVEYLIMQLRTGLFPKDFERIQSKSVIPSYRVGDFLELSIKVPSKKTQFEELISLKEEYANRTTLTKFIKNIRLVNTPEEIKNEIERFAKEIFKNSEYIEYKREFEFHEFPFSQSDIDDTRYIKSTKDGFYFNLLLVDEQKRINGVLTVQSDGGVNYEQYSEINSYANFIIQASSKYIQKNTNRLLNDFSHTTKNILKDIEKILSDFLETKNKDFIDYMKNCYLKDDEIIEDLIKKEKRKREDFLAYNHMTEAYNFVNYHFILFKRRHEYYTKSVNTKTEEIQLIDFIDRISIKSNRISLINNVQKDVSVLIKSAPVELAFADLISNAIKYSTDDCLKIAVNDRGHYIEFTISNKVNVIESKTNYENLGKEEIKKPDGTYSTGLYQAFRCINEENEISLANYDYYKAKKIFEVTVKLKTI